MRRRALTARRGFTLVEAMVASVILIIALLSLFQLQVVQMRANSFGDNLAQASALANDLGENVKLWSYGDSRLTPLGTYTSTSAPAIVATWDMGYNATASTRAQYADDASDPNAINSSALGSSYEGVSSPLDPSGKPIFIRYWNVYGIDLQGSGTPDGVLVQIIVRWRESANFYRQITSQTYKRNPAKVL